MATKTWKTSRRRRVLEEDRDGKRPWKSSSSGQVRHPRRRGSVSTSLRDPDRRNKHDRNKTNKTDARRDSTSSSRRYQNSWARKRPSRVRGNRKVSRTDDSDSSSAFEDFKNRCVATYKQGGKRIQNKSYSDCMRGSSSGEESAARPKTSVDSSDADSSSCSDSDYFSASTTAKDDDDMAAPRPSRWADFGSSSSESELDELDWDSPAPKGKWCELDETESQEQERKKQEKKIKKVQNYVDPTTSNKQTTVPAPSRVELEIVSKQQTTGKESGEWVGDGNDLVLKHSVENLREKLPEKADVKNAINTAISLRSPVATKKKFPQPQRNPKTTRAKDNGNSAANNIITKRSPEPKARVDVDIQTKRTKQLAKPNIETKHKAEHASPEIKTVNPEQARSTTIAKPKQPLLKATSQTNVAVLVEQANEIAKAVSSAGKTKKKRKKKLAPSQSSEDVDEIFRKRPADMSEDDDDSTATMDDSTTTLDDEDFDDADYNLEGSGQGSYEKLGVVFFVFLLAVFIYILMGHETVAPLEIANSRDRADFIDLTETTISRF
eukprot:TRINITY_DN2530_c0_g1_i1.p1 TRINITY_DN2530_c0_g1~~TRINITY_DN2530_c0_g1_i1.p1  ORF type:complete len:551 (-),score=96.53 TRINITY_DN2530_c0_g1_i1:1339-2991(-)